MSSESKATGDWEEAATAALDRREREMGRAQPPTTRPEAGWGITIGETADAVAWRERHEDHVARLCRELDGGSAYPPSGSDCRHPELWRAPHWRWLERLS